MKLKKLFFISAVSGVGKSTTCNYIKDNRLLENYVIFDIDELENINEYNNDTYNLFYKNAVTKAIEKSNDKNIIIGSCINPNDINNLNLSDEVDINMVLITCSNEELTKRLKARDESRNCSSDEFIKGEVDYQNYMINHLAMYDLHIDNTNSSIEMVSSQIVDYIKEKEKVNAI